jgi:MFS family permease
MNDPGAVHRARLRVALGDPALRAGFLGLAAAIAVDAAQLVSISVHLLPRHGAVGVVALGVVRALVPALCVPALTALSHRLGHGRLLCLLALAGATATAATTAAMAAGLPAGAVIGTAGVTSVCVCAARPITAALVPQLVRTPEQLVACSAVAGFVDGVGALVGPLLAGVTLAVAGPVPATGTTVLLLLGAALATRRIPRARPVAGAVARAPAPRPTSGTWLVIVLVSVQAMVRGALGTVLVVYVVDALGAADVVVGLLLAAIAVGSMAGLPVALAAIGPRLVFRVLGIGLVLWGLPLALAAPLHDLRAVVVLFAVVGVGNALVDVAHTSALPRIVAPERLGPVFGILEGTVQVGMAVGAAAGGILLAVMRPQVVLYVIGAALVGVAVAFAGRLHRLDRGLAHLEAEVDLLRRQPLFGSLPVSALDGLAQRMGRAEFAPGDVLMEEGAPGEDFLIVTDGVVLICKDDHVINIMSRGAAFGEIALVRDVPRTASAVAATEVSVRSIDRSSFLAALGHDPAARAAAESLADARLASTPRVAGGSSWASTTDPGGAARP